jgi:hypothetical protein
VHKNAGGDAENRRGGCGKPHATHIYIDKNKDNRREKKEPAADAVSLTNFFIEILQKRESDFSIQEKERKRWELEFDKFLSSVKSSPDKVMDVIAWAQGHKFYKRLASPSGIARKFNDMLIDKKSEVENSIIKINREKSLWFKNTYPEPFRTMTFDAKGVVNTANGKDLSFDMEPRVFEELLVKIFGGEYVRE